MKKFTFAVLAILGVTLGLASLAVQAHASAVYLYPPCDSAG
jgi:hypothetical protein